MTILSKNRDRMRATQIRRTAAGFVFACFLYGSLLLASASISLAQLSVPHPDYVAARPVINMYSKASDESDVVSQVLYGTGVSQLDKQKDWIHIETADG